MKIDKKQLVKNEILKAINLNIECDDKPLYFITSLAEQYCKLYLPNANKFLIHYFCEYARLTQLLNFALEDIDKYLNTYKGEILVDDDE